MASMAERRRMRISRYVTVLDTCVLAPMPVADTLLRLAEEPAFHTPRWSKHILDELERTLLNKFKYTETQVRRRLAAMNDAFPDAMVTGYEPLIQALPIDSKDAHVLAAAIRTGANAIVSDNIRHFPKSRLEPYGLECLTANDFMQHQYHLNPDAFINILTNQALDIEWPLADLISKHVPSLSKLIKL